MQITKKKKKKKQKITRNWNLSAISPYISLHSKAIGSLIGRGGSVIKGLIADSGCHIQIQQKDAMRPGQQDRDVTLSGH
jgi:polyribonucleotide nucleotidyltransferase